MAMNKLFKQSKVAKKKNKPLFKNETYKQGFMNGVKAGEEHAMKNMAGYIREKIDTLTDIPGIGEKTARKIKNHFLEKGDKDDHTSNQ